MKSSGNHMKPQEYDDNAFINCPFDKEYTELFDAIVFAISSCGFIPRSTREEPRSAENRLSQLMKIMSECKYGIHDVSRIELDMDTGLPRFNMPFELGIFLGMMNFGQQYHKSKKCLILDAEPYRYRKTISDIAGQDPDCHHNDVKEAIICVRNFLASASRRKRIPGGTFIYGDYLDFQKRLPGLCEEWKLNASELTFVDFKYLVAQGIWEKTARSRNLPV